MPTTPQVSIVLPVYNDEAWIATAIESCLQQTLEAIEVICVDDASTDRTREVIEQISARDPRVRLIRQERNLSAFQARRAGIESAAADHILFLDGDDELDRHAAQRTLAKAQATGADLVGFGVEVFDADGQTVGGYQKRLQPVHDSLDGDAVLPGLFPVGKPAQGQLWRYLFSTELLRAAYALLPDDLVLYRVNDLPITFLAVAQAARYVSVTDRLYRYHFRRGGSGNHVKDLAHFEYYLGAIASVDSIAPAVREIARTRTDADLVLQTFDSVKQSIIGNVVNYLQGSVSAELHPEALALMLERVSELEIVQAAVRHYPDALAVLAQHGPRRGIADRPVRSVLLTTKTLTTGGVSGVLLSQARVLSEAGYRVTIVAHRTGSTLDGVPEGVAFVELTGNLTTRLQTWVELCRTEAIDVIIDHQILYSKSWPAYALTARAVGVATIGWIHNFSLRPIYDHSDLLSFLGQHLGALATTVTLSPLDVAFWKLRGVEHTVYLPNPPSPMLLETPSLAAAKSAPTGPIQLVWWGRLEQHTKQVLELVEVAARLRKMSVDFRLRIIGPDWRDLTADRLSLIVAQRGLSDHVAVEGPLRGQALIDAIDAADVFVSTSIIEGYQLTLAEAQARGLPVVMYELPWLTVVQGNDGIVAVPQGDHMALAREIADLHDDPERYARLSTASQEAARRVTDFDFSAAYLQLVSDQLPGEFSPEPTLADAQALLDWMIFYAERDAGADDTGARKRRPSGAPSQPVGAVRRAARRMYQVFPGLKPIARRMKPLARKVKRLLRGR